MSKKRTFSIVLVLLLGLGLPQPGFADAIEQSIKFVQSNPDYTEIKSSDTIALNLRYATTNNFVGQNMYGPFNRAYLHRIAAAKLEDAAKNLSAKRPGYRLIVFDALRPRSVQYVLWNQVKGTSQEKYVANPKGGSIHNFGFAVDLSIVDGQGKELDMGTPYDDFTPLAEPQLEEKFLAAGKLTPSQLENRRLLRTVMQNAGFYVLSVEWWHFDALPKAEVRTKYKIVE
jgi:D-alanyl-D-alanine dipeptidase